MRTLKYFGIQAEKMMAFVLGLGLLYGIIFGGMFSGTAQEKLDIVMNYILMIGMITIITAQSSLIKLNMPLVLSLGCGRKEAFWGAQWMVALLAIQFEIISLLSRWLFLHDIQKYAGFMVKILPFICIASGAISELLAILVLKFGNLGILSGILCMTVVAVVMVFTLNDRVGDMNTALSMLSNSFQIALFVLLSGLYAVFGVIYYHVWKKYELKAF